MNMNMELHHQKQIFLRDGHIINAGEDGKPYAKDGILIVADGLGGRGGYPHTGIDKRILDKEELYGAIFKPVLGDANDDFKQFVSASFAELFELKDRYFTVPGAMRTSGYYASRLVTAIVLHELKYNGKFDRKEIFVGIDEIPPELRDEHMKKYGDLLAECIQEKLEEIANRAGLELESKTKGSFLLPSTLTVAICDEHDDYVDILYLWAGDSRGYLWDKNGLAQLTDDHERDETMTNLITLTKPFGIEARYVRARKPVILFNATDGCYKCQCFASPLDLEYSILLALNEAKSFDEVSRMLDNTFKDIGTHDDSNTMALQTFGYGDYEAVRAAVRTRMEYISENIESKLDGIFTRDYTGEYDAVMGKIERQILGVKDSLFELPSVREMVEIDMRGSNYPPLVKRRAELTRALSDLNEDKKALKQKIQSWVKDNWLSGAILKYYGNAEAAAAMHDRTSRERNNLIRKMENSRAEYDECLNSAIAEFELNLQKVWEVINKLKDFDGVVDKSVRSLKLKEYFYDLNKCLLTKFKESIFEDRTTAYHNARKKLDDINAEIEDRDQFEIQAFTENIVSRKIKINTENLDESNRECFEKLFTDYMATVAELERVNEETKTFADKYLQRYWTENAARLVGTLWREHRALIPEEILKSRNVGDLERERTELEGYIATRTKLYEEYDEGYFRQFKESTL